VLVIHQSDAQLDRHGRLEQGHPRPQRPDRQGQGFHVTEAEAEAQLLDFLARYSAQRRGAHVRQHHRAGPPLSGEVHAQAGGVFSLPQSGCQHPEGAGQALAPEVYNAFKKQQKHTALADVHESIDELAHYREHFLQTGLMPELGENPNPCHNRRLRCFQLCAFCASPFTHRLN
jgi:oligoribonuclease